MKSQGYLNKRKIKGASKRDTLRGAGIWRPAHLPFNIHLHPIRTIIKSKIKGMGAFIP